MCFITSYIRFAVHNYEVMPDTMRKVADILPLAQGMKILKSATPNLPVENI